MAKEIKLTLPIYYTYKYARPKTIKRKLKGKTITKQITERTFLVGMNWFRNENPFTIDKVKVHYHRLVSEQLQGLGLKIPNKYTTEYKVFYKSKVCDATNIIPVLEKFSLDALQDLGVTKEDNVEYHIGSDGWTVEFDKENPRIEITIRSYDVKMS